MERRGGGAVMKDTALNENTPASVTTTTTKKINSNHLHHDDGPNNLIPPPPPKCLGTTHRDELAAPMESLQPMKAKGPTKATEEGGSGTVTHDDHLYSGHIPGVTLTTTSAVDKPAHHT
ncbi:unnamed protein product [Arctogadus glacialis]